MNNIFADIIPAGALGIEVAEWNGERIKLTAPLEPNLNDKGTAFAGSIDSMLDLAGWGAITLALHDRSIESEVMIVCSETVYTAAVRAGMTSFARLPDAGFERVMEELEAHGRSRLSMRCQLTSVDTACATMNAQYAIIKT